MTNNYIILEDLHGIDTPLSPGLVSEQLDGGHCVCVCVVGLLLTDHYQSNEFVSVPNMRLEGNQVKLQTEIMD